MANEEVKCNLKVSEGSLQQEAVTAECSWGRVEVELMLNGNKLGFIYFRPLKYPE